ncbi:hypothetical protein NMG60_11033133 [Bertholletia excelsa]
MGKLRKVCVFCGSNSGYKKIFSDAAVELGRELVERKMDLTYGGEVSALWVWSLRRFIMVAVTFLDGTPVGEVLVVSDMHERKAEMARRADAFIALPGGYGTMDELLENISWSQLGIHDKPVGILNIDGYYDSLLAFFDRGVEDGFIKFSSRNILIPAKGPKGIIESMENYIPVHEQVAPTNSWNIEEPEITNS